MSELGRIIQKADLAGPTNTNTTYNAVKGIYSYVRPNVAWSLKPMGALPWINTALRRNTVLAYYLGWA